MTAVRKFWSEHKRLAVEVFALLNLAFLAVDIRIAHSVNQFAHQEEWIPFYFSVLCVLPLMVAARRIVLPTAPDLKSTTIYALGCMSILIGVAGLGYHTASQFLREQTIKNLVYTAPLVAPLSYAGIGALLIINRYARNQRTWAFCLLFLALGGFFGNFLLALLDHAQNGFFRTSEWLPVFSAALAVGFLAATILMEPGGVWRWWVGVIIALQIPMGLAGLFFHLQGDIMIRGLTWDALVYGPPIFAPLLYPNLAIVAAVGLLELYTEPSALERTPD